MVRGPEDEDPPDSRGVDLSVGVGGAGAAVAVASVRADDGAGTARRISLEVAALSGNSSQNVRSRRLNSGVLVGPTVTPLVRGLAVL